MSLSLEQVPRGDWDALNRVISRLQSLVIDTGGRSVGIRFGATTVTWAGGTPFTAAKTVTHGLGGPPVAVLATPNNSISTCFVDTVGPMTFNVTLHTDDGSTPGAGTTRTVYWLVIG